MNDLSTITRKQALLIGVATVAAVGALTVTSMGTGLVGLLVCAACVGGLALWCGWRPALPASQATSGARFATFSEMAAAGWTDPRGWPLGEVTVTGWRPRTVPIYLPVDRHATNVFLNAPTGMGKTLNLVRPIVRSYARWGDPAAGSLIIIDPKGDLYASTAADLRRAGYRVAVWNISRPAACTVALDPLATIPSWDDPGYIAACEHAVSSFLAATQGPFTPGERFWSTQPAAILRAVVLLRKQCYPGATWPAIGVYIAETPIEQIAQDIAAFSTVRAAHLRGRAIDSLLQSPKTLAGITPELIDRLIILADPRAERALGGVDEGELPVLTAGDLLASPTALFLQAETLTDYLLPFLSVALASLTADLVSTVTTPGGKLSRPLRVIGDEMGNLGPVYNLPVNLAMLRSYDIGHLLVYQDRAQVASHYGHAAADTLIANCTTQLALGGLSDNDAEDLSRRLGRRSFYSPSYSESDHGRSTSYHLRDESLLTADAIRRLSYEMVVDSAGLRPFILALVPDTEGV